MTSLPITSGPDAAAPDLVARAAELHDLVAAGAAEADRQRRLAERTMDAVRDAGLMRLMTPRRFGGWQTDGRTLLDVTIELGRACGSTAWVVGIMNTAAWLAGLYPERAQEEVWADGPDTGLIGVFAPTAAARAVDGGLVVTGSWGYASGSLHSEWAIVGVPIHDDAGRPADRRLALIPFSDLTLEDTWHVAGMRGTGSNTVHAKDVFVPEHRLISFDGAIDGRYAIGGDDVALYRAHFVGQLTFAIDGPLVGLADAALAYVIAKAPRRSVPSSVYRVQAQSVAFQVEIAEAAAKIDAARLLARRAADSVDASARDGVYPDALTRARTRMDTGLIARLCREAVDQLMTAHGTSGFATAAPLERIWRDVETASRHAIANDGLCRESYGKALLGIETRVTGLL